MRAWARDGFEVRQPIERKVYLARRSAVFVPTHFFEELRRQVCRLEEAQEREVRIDAGGNDVGEKFIAIRERDADGLAILYQDLRDRSFRADLDASLPRRVCNGVRDSSGAAARKSPRAERPVDLTH